MKQIFFTTLFLMLFFLQVKSQTTDWKLSGNSVLFDSRLGTNNGYDLIFETANTERMRLKDNGFIGIGTLAPEATLHVVGNVKMDGVIRLGDFVDASAEPMRFVYTDESGILKILSGSQLIQNFYAVECFPFTSADGTILTYPAPSWASAPGGTDGEPGRLWTGNVCPANVGIGTANPEYSLDVKGSLFSGNSLSHLEYIPEQGLRLQTNNSVPAFRIFQEDGTQVFRVSNSGETRINHQGILGSPLLIQSGENIYTFNSEGWFRMETNRDFDNSTVFSVENHNDWYSEHIFKLRANGTMELRTIDSDAIPFKITKGTFITNDEELDLMAIDNNGRVFSRAVTVKNTPFWPDYVFADDYQLMSTDSLAAYIEEHNHLPNIPTAKEIAAEGADLYELNRLLMEKVEELTLYLLEQSKRIDSLEKDLEKQKSK